jgi:hypothetical protein
MLDDQQAAARAWTAFVATSNSTQSPPQGTMVCHETTHGQDIYNTWTTATTWHNSHDTGERSHGTTCCTYTAGGSSSSSNSSSSTATANAYYYNSTATANTSDRSSSTAFAHSPTASTTSNSSTTMAFFQDDLPSTPLWDQDQDKQITQLYAHSDFLGLDQQTTAAIAHQAHARIQQHIQYIMNA